MSEPAIKIRGIGKEYRLGNQQKKGLTFREMLAGAGSDAVRKLKSRSSSNGKEPKSFWALNDVSFDVPAGEVVGLIGRNGAGKSTLLKVLSRITEPTKGYIDICGRVGSLLEVGTGFHPELSGRENVYLNGAILGMRRAEIDRRFDEIVAFSEVESFIDTPVKHYSSGMYLRLAFAVAAHLETEILLVDEVLAVGDAIFQKKCLGKMSEVATAGRTVILVSHNMLAISRLCTQAVLLSKGEVESIGPADQVIDGYMRETMGRDAAIDLGGGSQDGFRLTNANLFAQGIETACTVRSGDSLELVLDYDSGGESPLYGARLWVSVRDSNGTPLFVCNSKHSSLDPITLPAKGVMKFQLPRLPLLPGSYTVSAQFKSQNADLAKYDDFIVIEVVEGDFFGTGVLPTGRGGSILVDHHWTVNAFDAPRLTPSGRTTEVEVLA